MSEIILPHPIPDYISNKERAKAENFNRPTAQVQSNVLKLKEEIENLGTDVEENYEPAFEKNTAFNKNFGTTSNTVCEGNDQRLSDARTPVAHNHDASNINSGILDLDHMPSHIHDTSNITSGIFDLDRIPHGALERLYIVANQAARFALTPEQVQKGDTIKQEDTGVMYFVIDQTKLNNEDGYVVYTASTATSVPWAGVTNKPLTFLPSIHDNAAHSTNYEPSFNKNTAFNRNFGSEANTVCQGNDLRLSDRRDPKITTITGDWNDVLTTGFFQGNDLANECPGGSWRFCVVMVHNLGWVSQTMNDFMGTGIYQRNRSNNVWGPWRRLDASKFQIDLMSFGTIDNTYTDFWKECNGGTSYIYRQTPSRISEISAKLADPDTGAVQPTVDIKIDGITVLTTPIVMSNNGDTPVFGILNSNVNVNTGSIITVSVTKGTAGDAVNLHVTIIGE